MGEEWILWYENCILIKLLEKNGLRTSLAVQWLRLRTSNAGGAGSIPGQGTKISRATQRSQKKKKSDDFSNVWSPVYFNNAFFLSSP